MNPALKAARLNSAHPVQAPSGRWYIAGSAPAELALEQPDGSAVTPEQARSAAQVGPRMAGVRTRTWTTRDALVAALRAYGWEGS